MIEGMIPGKFVGFFASHSTYSSTTTVSNVLRFLFSFDMYIASPFFNAIFVDIY